MERTLTTDGSILDERVVDTGDYPPNLAELVESGDVGPDGRMYARVTGMFSDGSYVHMYDHIEVVQTAPKQERNKPAGVPAVPRETPVIAPELAAKLGDEPLTNEVYIHIRPKERPQTSLRRARAPLGFASMAWADAERAEHEARIQARKDDVDTMHADLKTFLHEQRATDVTSFWLGGSLGARVPLGAVPAIAQHPDVATIGPEMHTHQSNHNWTGVDMRHTDGLSAGYFIDNGFDGDRANPDIRLAVIDFDGFDLNHSGFKTGPTGTRIHSSWNCNSSSCSSGAGSPTGDHGTRVAGAAAGDHRDGQVSGQTDAWETIRSGVCEECALVLLDRGTPVSDYLNALQKAVDEGADIVVNSSGGDSMACDSVFQYYPTDAATYDAYEAGLLIVNAAGNNGHAGGCNLLGFEEMMSAFAVGGLGNDSNECDADSNNLYRSCDRFTQSSRGGMNITVNGSVYSGEVSQVSAVVPACPRYQFVPYSAFDSSVTECGTSLAAPQVAGAAGLFADWHIDELGVAPGVGTLHSWLLVMTDRFVSPNVKALNAFNPITGGGRLQMRYWGDNGVGADEGGGVWGWEAAEYTVSNSTADIWNQMVGIGTEPSTLNQFKAYMTFFEQNNTNAADVDLEIWKNNCTSGLLRADGSRDVKSMTATGTAAAGQALCAKVITDHVPAGQTRKVILIMYYSDETDFR